MDIEQLKRDLNEYFEYIKVVYINQFGRYLKSETNLKIRSFHDVFEIDLDKKFKYYCDEKIVFCLDIRSFIEENGLENSPDMNDISERGKAYVYSLLEAKNNVYTLIKGFLLKQIITYFIGGEKSAIKEATIAWISKILAERYHLPNNEFLTSKEIHIFYKLESIVGRDIILTSILNGEKELLENHYNLYSQKQLLGNFKELEEKLNLIFFNYQRNKNKLYLIDSIYHYENLDYETALKEVLSVEEEKQAMEEIHKKRIISIKESLTSMLEYEIPFRLQERQQIINAITEAKKIIHKFDDEDYSLNELKYYQKMIMIEDNMLPFAEKMWQQYLIYPTNYLEESDFEFLIGTIDAPKSDILEVSLITDQHVKKFGIHSKYNYGFIYYFRGNSLLYATSEDVLLKKIEDANHTLDTIYVEGIPYELDNQSVSKLITPKMIVSADLEHGSIQNKIFLKSKTTYPVAIFVFTNSDKENSSIYKKALEIASNHQLPLIEIEKDFYYEKREVKENSTITEVTPKVEEKRKISFKEKMKEITEKWLYEEDNEKDSQYNTLLDK